MAASLANRLLLRSSMPTSGQVVFWDRVLVAISRVLDPMVGWRIGKSVIAIWTRADTAADTMGGGIEPTMSP
jgi:hypothetical protein